MTHTPSTTARRVRRSASAEADRKNAAAALQRAGPPRQRRLDRSLTGC